MPIIFDPKTKRHIVVGDNYDPGTVTPETPSAPAAKPKPQQPWWSQLKQTVDQGVQKLLGDQPGGALLPFMNADLAGKKNMIKFELKQLTDPKRAIPRLTHHVIRTLPGIGQRDLANTAQLGLMQATSNVVRNAVDPFTGGDYTRSPIGRAADEYVEEGYQAIGEKPPSTFTDEQKAGDEARASLMLNLALGQGFGAALGGLQGTAVAPLANRVAGALNPANAKTLMGGLARAGAGLGIEEAFSTPLDDNTGGSFLGLLQALGAPVQDTVKPGMSRTEATAAAFGPNLAGSALLATPFLAGGLANIKRARVANSTKSRRQQIRNQQVADGVIEQAEDGQHQFTQQALLDPEAQQAPKPAEAAEAAPEVEANYDSSLPESDALQEALENASDAELQEIAQAQAGIPAATEEVLSRPRPGLNEDAQYEAVAAPLDKLAIGPTKYSDQLGQVDTGTLLSLAHPDNSPGLTARITDLTGKDYEQFDRLDVVAGIKALESEGRTVIPNRLMGQPMLMTGEIQVDPARFQFKQDVDKEGRQTGASLTGVERWNPGMEGMVQVWTDPMDGNTYVVNGHNRLAKAKELGIPSMRVEYINASNDAQARAQGALTNIAEGRGTAFDAAKYFRDSGITSPDQLAFGGMPMSEGNAAAGIALANLPANIFQDAVDGRVSKGKAIALGGSGLSEEQMQQAYKALSGRNLSNEAFDEVIQQAKSAPVVEGNQVDLFGNTETLSLMVEKGRLAARIRGDLMSDSNLMGRTAANADKLQTAGNVIDQAGTQGLSNELASALAEFDAQKYAEGPISDLLNEGVMQLQNGARLKPVADRIRRQLVDALQPRGGDMQKLKEQGIEAKSQEEFDGLLDRTIAEKEKRDAAPVERTALINQIVSKAARNGEVRPPSSPLPDVPADKGAPINKAAADLAEGRVTEDVIRVLDEELRLREEHKRLDDAMEADRIASEREAMDYENLTFDERKGAGMLEGIQAPEATKKAPTFAFPADLAKSKPRYGMASVVFESELDRAAYILRDGAKQSKGEERLIAALQAQGYDIASIRQHGNKVRDALKRQVTTTTGSARAPQEAMDLSVPAQGFDAPMASLDYQGIRASYVGNAYDEDATRYALTKMREQRIQAEQLALEEYGYKISTDAVRTLRMSRRLAAEALTAMGDAIKVAGIPVERFKWMDEIDLMDMFPADMAAGAVENWEPGLARFMRENPTDPLSRYAQGEVGGLRIPAAMQQQFFRDSIFLALHPALRKRLGGPLSGQPRGGRPFAHDAFHEAFHRLQEALFGVEVEALKTPEAKAEMRRIIQEGGGNYTESMAQTELEAEAFAVWSMSRRKRLAQGGVQALFERTRQFLNTFGQKLRYVLKQDPRYTDVFELAYRGDIGKRTYDDLTPEQLQDLTVNLDKRMAEQMPELTARIQSYLVAKKAEYDKLMDEFMAEALKEGC